MHRFWLIGKKLNSKGFFWPLVATHWFKIKFPTKKFLAKFFIKMHRFRLIHQTLNSKGFFRPLVVTHFLQNVVFLKNALIPTYLLKNEFERFFFDPWWGHICSKINFLRKNSLAKIFIKMHRFRLIHQKLNSKGFFWPLVVTYLFKFQFLTKNVIAKIFIEMHGFQLLYQPKTKIKRSFSTPGGDPFFQNSIFYKKFLS